MEPVDTLKDEGLDTGLDLHISTTSLKRNIPAVTPNARQQEIKRLRGEFGTVDGSVEQGRLESFRHLFSFGAKADAGKGGIAATFNKEEAVGGGKEPSQGQQAQQKAKSKDTTQTSTSTGGFFLFGRAEEDNTQNTALGPDEDHSVKATAHTEKHSSKVKKRKEKGKSVIDDDDDGDAMQVDDDVNAEEEDGITTDHPLIVADVHDDAFVHMLATRFFVRDKDVERLDTQWTEMDGLRDEMRMDFKLKRQNIQRGRKLGSTAARKDWT